MPIEYLLSGHAQKRFKERLNIKNFRRAYRDMEHAYTKGRLLSRMQTDGICYMLFNDTIYIFNECVTKVCKVVILLTVYKDLNKMFQVF